MLFTVFIVTVFFLLIFNYENDKFRLFKSNLQDLCNFRPQYLEIFRTKSVFKQISIAVNVAYNKNNRIPIFMSNNVSNPS